jgi:hypothetical protein
MTDLELSGYRDKQRREASKIRELSRNCSKPVNEFH